jgi:hypothetical protein
MTLFKFHQVYITPKSFGKLTDEGEKRRWSHWFNGNINIGTFPKPPRTT